MHGLIALAKVYRWYPLVVRNKCIYSHFPQLSCKALNNISTADIYLSFVHEYSVVYCNQS